MTLRISGQAFSDDLFNELAYMDERHEWDAYHERYQLNKGHLGMLAFEDEEFKKQDGTNTEEAIIKTTEKSCPGLPPVVMTCLRRSVVMAQLNQN